MDSKARPYGPPSSCNKGFTLIELMIVVLIIGLLASIGLANYLSMQENARYASCISNQRHVHEASLIYANDTNLIGNAVINVNVLTAAGILVQQAGECPSSGNADWDDYTIQFTAGDVSQIVCSIRGADHLYQP